MSVYYTNVTPGMQHKQNGQVGTLQSILFPLMAPNEQVDSLQSLLFPLMAPNEQVDSLQSLLFPLMAPNERQPTKVKVICMGMNILRQRNAVEGLLHGRHIPKES